MDDYKNLIWWLRWMGAGQTGESTYTKAADAFEKTLAENEALRRHVDDLTQGNAVMVQEFNKKIEELHETKSELDRLKTERDAAYRRLGGEPPKTCKTCDLLGKDGWSQHEIGYCEGDDHPHGPDDFCSRHCTQKEA